MTHIYINVHRRWIEGMDAFLHLTFYVEVMTLVHISMLVELFCLAKRPLADYCAATANFTT